MVHLGTAWCTEGGPGTQHNLRTPSLDACEAGLSGVNTWGCKGRGFNDNDFWNNITNLSKILANDDKLRQMNGNRGSEHFIYMNRTFFGLYHLLHDLKAVIKTENFRKYLK